MTNATLTIGQCAERAGVATSTIRFYERRGLLAPAERVAGQRRYGDAELRRLEVISVAKGAGFSLDEARVLLDAVDAGTPMGGALREMADRRLPDVEALIARAEEMRDWLRHAQGCRCASPETCGLFTLT